MDTIVDYSDTDMLQHGTTVTLTNLFASLPVRRKDLEKNAKREFTKALNLLHAYALVPCAQENQGQEGATEAQAAGATDAEVKPLTDITNKNQTSLLALFILHLYNDTVQRRISAICQGPISALDVGSSIAEAVRAYMK